LEKEIFLLKPFYQQKLFPNPTIYPKKLIVKRDVVVSPLKGLSLLCWQGLTQEI
jgi:hypothetical protein